MVGWPVRPGDEASPAPSATGASQLRWLPPRPFTSASFGPQAFRRLFGMFRDFVGTFANYQGMFLNNYGTLANY